MMIPEHPHLPVLPVRALEPPLSPPKKIRWRRKRKGEKRPYLCCPYITGTWANSRKPVPTSPLKKMSPSPSIPQSEPINCRELHFSMFTTILRVLIDSFLSRLLLFCLLGSGVGVVTEAFYILLSQLWVCSHEYQAKNSFFAFYSQWQHGSRHQHGLLCQDRLPINMTLSGSMAQGHQHWPWLQYKYGARCDWWRQYKLFTLTWP